MQQAPIAIKKIKRQPKGCLFIEANTETYLRAGGTSVQVPCATSAAMPMLSPSVG